YAPYNQPYNKKNAREHSGDATDFNRHRKFEEVGILLERFDIFIKQVLGIIDWFAGSDTLGVLLEFGLRKEMICE
ncbi:MAG: hypothetical protein JRF72_12460, partial [Deltaproteobacteria bacterium]|nr:hypothetical protein [Deltaproteobacteria bacterium]